MQFKKSAVFGVLIMLYLSTDSWCHYIPERKTAATGKKNGTTPPSEQIQICGNALTNFVIEACDGIVGSLNEANSTRSSVQSKITEDCCDQECPLDYLQTYCGNTPLFTIKKTLRGKLLSQLFRNRPPVFGTAGRAPKAEEDKKKTPLEPPVWVSAPMHVRANLLFLLPTLPASLPLAWECFSNGSNSINRTWPSIEIGTISPEIEKFGGQPIIVVRKNKSNSS